MKIEFNKYYTKLGPSYINPSVITIYYTIRIGRIKFTLSIDSKVNQKGLETVIPKEIENQFISIPYYKDKEGFPYHDKGLDPYLNQIKKD